jgi:hypothetical protein
MGELPRYLGPMQPTGPPLQLVKAVHRLNTAGQAPNQWQAAEAAGLGQLDNDELLTLLHDITDLLPPLSTGTTALLLGYREGHSAWSSLEITAAGCALVASLP